MHTEYRCRCRWSFKSGDWRPKIRIKLLLNNFSGFKRPVSHRIPTTNQFCILHHAYLTLIVSTCWCKNMNRKMKRKFNFLLSLLFSLAMMTTTKWWHNLFADVPDSRCQILPSTFYTKGEKMKNKLARIKQNKFVVNPSL